jgi:hypothetical protein
MVGYFVNKMDLCESKDYMLWNYSCRVAERIVVVGPVTFGLLSPMGELLDC